MSFSMSVTYFHFNVNVSMYFEAVLFLVVSVSHWCSVLDTKMVKNMVTELEYSTHIYILAFC